MRVRVTQSAVGAGVLAVSVAVDWGRAGEAPSLVQVQAPFVVEPDDVERLRWYLEDYLEWPLDPAPELAGGVERRLVEVGTELFRALFASTEDARDLWAEIRRDLPAARFEVPPVQRTVGPAYSE